MNLTYGDTEALDTNAVFSDGAELDIDIGDADGGSTKLKYEFAETESEEHIIVAFGFNDGPQFQVPLKLTSTNT